MGECECSELRVGSALQSDAIVKKNVRPRVRVLEDVLVVVVVLHVGRSGVCHVLGASWCVLWKSWFLCGAQAARGR